MRNIKQMLSLSLQQNKRKKENLKSAFGAGDTVILHSPAGDNIAALCFRCQQLTRGVGTAGTTCIMDECSAGDGEKTC